MEETENYYQGWVVSKRDLDVCYYPIIEGQTVGYHQYTIRIFLDGRGLYIKELVRLGYYLTLTDHFPNPGSPADMEILAFQIEYGISSELMEVLKEGLILFSNNFGEYL